MFRFIICDDDENFCENDKQYIEEFYERKNIKVQVSSSIDECHNYIHEKLKENDGKRYIIIPEEKKRIPVDKIMYASSKAHRVYYHIAGKSDDQEYSVYGKLNDEEKRLSDSGFFRVHQSYLLNMNYVKDVVRYEAVLTDGQVIPISKSRYKDVESYFIREKGTC